MAFRIFWILFRVFVSFIVLILFLVVVLSFSSVQTFIAEKITETIHEKTGAIFSIGSLKISYLNKIDITDIYIQDQKADTLLYLNLLKLEFNPLDLLRNKINIDKIKLEKLTANLNRKNSENNFNYQFLIDSLFPQTSDTADSGKQWVIQVKELSLKNIRASFIDEPSDINEKINFDSLELTIKDFDLDKKLISLDQLFLKNASMQIVSTQPDTIEKNPAVMTDSIKIAGSDIKSTIESSIFLDWKISADRLNFEGINFKYDNNAYPESADELDFNHIFISNLFSNIRVIDISENGYKAEIDSMKFNERCGFRLEKLSVDAVLTNQTAELKRLILETSQSKISTDAKLSYKSFNDLLNDLGNSEAVLDLKYANVNPKDLLLFSRKLETDTIAGKFMKNNISVSAKASGKINNLNIDNLEISLLQKTTLKMHGRLAGLPTIEKLRLNTDIDSLSTFLPDVYQFVDSNKLAGLQLPNKIQLNGDVKGKLDSLSSELNIISDLGTIYAKTFYRKRINGRDTINVILNAKNILAGRILGDTIIGKISISGKANAVKRGNGIYDGTASFKIDEARYKSYDYKNIIIDCRLDSNLLTAAVNSIDSNLNFELNAAIDFREAIKKYSADLTLNNLDFNALHFTHEKYSIAANINANLNFAGLNNLNANLGMMNSIITNDGKRIPVKKFEVIAASTPNDLKIQISSDFVDGTIDGNIDGDNIEKTFRTAFRKYLGDTSASDLVSGKYLSLQINIRTPKEILHLFSPELEELRITKLDGTYNSNNNDLSLEMQIPSAEYAGMKLDSTNIFLTGKDESLSLDVNAQKITYKNLSIENLAIKEETNHRKVLSHIQIGDSTEPLRYLLANEFEFGKDFFKMRFLPDGLILDSKPWEVSEANLFMKNDNAADSITSNYKVEQFVFKNDSQSIGIVTEGNKHKLAFTNFGIENFTDMVNYESKTTPKTPGGKIFRGSIDGDIVFPSPESPNAVNSILNINNIYVLDSLAGSLSLIIAARDDTMNIDAKLENGENALQLKGVVDHLSGEPVYDLSILIDAKNLHQMEHFSLGALSEVSGRIDGSLTLKGTMEKPELNGYIGFDETAFRVNSLNFHAKIKHDKITVENKRVHFDNFAIEDSLGEKLTINGDILTSNLSNLGFDLDIVSKKYQPMNSTKADNKIFYGKLSVETEVMLKGDVNNLNIDANIKIDNITNLTYALPGSELKLITPEGIVQFVDSAQAFDSLLLAQQGDYMRDSILSKMKGLKFKAHIEIDPGAKFTIDVDPKSGDYLTLNGNSKLDITSDGEGKQTVNGIYEVNSGTYQLSFYDLVKKNFTIKPGSTVVWSGQPMDAVMNITAEYIVRTSSVALVANESSSMTEEEKKVFNKRLPYEIKLNIQGLLSKPEISFNISLPNQYLSDNPIVAAKLAQLNTVEMTDQLNKQVFALLVTGGFMAENPMSTGGSSNNIASTAARNSVNGILSNQLNNMSSKYISGVDVNFGLTSYEDYASSSGDTRTEMDIQVSKKLFNDRLVVEAENSYNLNGDKKQTTDIYKEQGHGQFSVTYSLSETGEYKLRAYYQNAYDPFDGDISYSGIAIIFEKELDSLKPGKSAKVKPVENEK